MEECEIVGVTADSTKVLVSVKLSRPTVLGSVMDLAARCHLSVVAPLFLEGQVRFFAERDAEAEWRKQLELLAVDGFVESYQIASDLVPLTVVGRRFSQDGSAIQQVIETLARNHISVTMGTASSLAVTVAVPATHADDGVRALHKELIHRG
jgi:aspartokinase